MSRHEPQIQVSLLCVPDAMVSILSGIYDVLNCFELLSSFDDAVPKRSPFEVEIVSAREGSTRTASGFPLPAHRHLDEVGHSDIVIIPSLMVENGRWITGRYPQEVQWMSSMHRGGATLCSACSGVLLLAETGLLDRREATIHWAYARTFRANFPEVDLRIERVLVATGDERFLMSGASASWHDLVLYLVARRVGPTAAQAIAKFMLLQWHTDGQAPYVVFDPPMDHGDAAVLEAQQWLEGNYRRGAPVEQMIGRSGVPERSFKRRFTKATGLSPIRYVQQLRVQEAKRRLERTDEPIDEISWAVGYEDPAFFRRLFKRVARITPGEYRRKFHLARIPAPGLGDGTGAGAARR